MATVTHRTSAPQSRIRVLIYSILLLSLISCYDYDQFIRRGLDGENLYELEVFGEKMSGGDVKVIELDGFRVEDFNDEVVKGYIKGFQTGGRKWFQQSLDRAQIYLPFIRRTFEEYGVPTDLAYLPLIESEFVLSCKSHAGALGLWQFMPLTGMMYGMSINYWVDERKDPIKSTHAAAKHLKRLYPNFKSWVLALAAYNAGGGKISRSIKKYKSNNFWELVRAKALAQETMRYVPKFIAATMIAKNPERYGFKVNKPPVDYEHFDTVYIDDAADLKIVSDMAHVNYEDIKTLNPELNQWITPPKVLRYPLRLPKGTGEPFMNTFSAVPPSDRVTFRQHTMRTGETLSHLAAFYDVPMQAILDINRIRNASLLQVNQMMLIPVRGLSNARQIDEKEYDKQVEETKIGKYVHFKKLKRSATPTRDVVYCVGRNETLWTVAMKYNVSMEEIKAWNGLSGFYVSDGQELFVRIPEKRNN